jgi:hypothetical protein
MTVALRCEHCGTALRELNRSEATNELLCLDCHLARSAAQTGPNGGPAAAGRDSVNSVAPPGQNTNNRNAAGATSGLTKPDPTGEFCYPAGQQNPAGQQHFAALAAPISEKLKDVPPEPDWQWDGYLSPGALTLFAGRPKVGKTTLLFPLFAALEHGLPFLGRPTNATRALMLSEEREQTLAQKQQLFLNGADPHLLMRHEAGGLRWSEVIEQARAYCAEHEIGLLAIDTWDKWTGLRGDDESKAGAVIEALEPLMLAASDGLAVCVACHQRKAAGKHGEAVRGSNALTGSVDVVVELERAPEELGRRMRVLRSESRFSSTPDELVAELTEGGDYVAQAGLDEIKHEHEAEEVVRLVEAAPGSTTDELADGTGVARLTLAPKLGDALAGKLIARTGAGKKGDPYRWHPVPQQGGEAGA